MAKGVNSKLKVLLIQLPHPCNISRNIPLAPGYLKAWAHRCRLLDEADIEILPPESCDRSGCRRLIDLIVAKSPDILGVSLYLWNSVRTLFIVEQVRKRLPHLIVVAGGPEVSLANATVVNAPGVDFMVLGEGEETFADLLRHFLRQAPELAEIPGIAFRQDGALRVNRDRPPIEKLELLPSPYLLGYIDPGDYREMMIFTMRGCLQGCRYCAWSARGGLRPFHLDQLRDELLLARKMEKEVIFSIADSAFDTSPVFREFCAMAGRINADGRLHFNCFVQAERIDRETAQLLKDAHVVGVEVGLQSTSAEVLRHVARPVDLGKFREGVANLKKVGIPVVVDTILGLPGDTLAGFEKTIEYLAEHRSDASVFNLSISQGSNLRENMQHFGIEVQEEPPFYVRGTASFPETDIREAMRRYLNLSADFNPLNDLLYPMIAREPRRAGIEGVLSGADVAGHPPAFPVTHLVVPLGSSAATDRLASLSEMIALHAASHLTVLCLSAGGMKAEDTDSLQTLMLAISRISRHNPFITWDIMFEGFGSELRQEVLDRVRSCLSRLKNFLDYRYELFPPDGASMCRTAANVLGIFPWSGGNAPAVREKDCILKVVFGSGGPGEVDPDRVLDCYGSAVLVDFPAGVSLETVTEIMGRIRGNNRQGKPVFFSDWVLHRIWEQDFLKVTPDKQNRFELLIDPQGAVVTRSGSDADLYWDAITRWGLLRPEYGVRDLERLIAEKVSERLSADGHVCKKA